MEDFLNILGNGRRPEYFSQWKTTSFFGRWKTTTINWKLKNDQLEKIIWQMEENLNIFSLGRPHQFLFKWNVTNCNMLALS
jgi:hypothetical protein